MNIIGEIAAGLEETPEPVLFLLLGALLLGVGLIARGRRRRTPAAARREVLQ